MHPIYGVDLRRTMLIRRVRIVPDFP